ncbi:MAG: BrxA/BrxB family bacilliredoxin [Candidatus Hydrogenedens sp.]|nr:BrxA/BrxB family bacilliredoxin [Candidatus Hydrogenedentota bacterium]NLF56122.1 BrxA/BrxB family bacilliredoxin [Candidatus Hydrogenedens sp.]
MAPKYDPELVEPLWKRMVEVGFESLTSAEEVRDALNRPGTTLCLINSVCGCAARGARPGVALALQHDLIPDHLITVFAGMDHEAVAAVRDALPGVPPSSPCVALFRGGEPVAVIERRHIESMGAVELANRLQEIFDRECTRRGPSVTPDVFDALEFEQMCSSTLML